MVQLYKMIAEMIRYRVQSWFGLYRLDCFTGECRDGEPTFQILKVGSWRECAEKLREMHPQAKLTVYKRMIGCLRNPHMFRLVTEDGVTGLSMRYRHESFPKKNHP